MGSRIQKVANVVVVAAIGGFDTANAIPGTLVLDTGTGIMWAVRLVGTTRSLVQVGAGGSDPFMSRTFTLTPTPGAGGSGDVAYTLTVLNGALAPVSRAVVNVGVERVAGAGAITVLSIADGVPLVNSVAADELGLVISATAGGVVTFTISGTPGDTINTLVCTDAPNGGFLLGDTGRVLP